MSEKTVDEIKEFIKKEIECCHNLSIDLPIHAASRYHAIMTALEYLLSWITEKETDEND